MKELISSLFATGSAAFVTLVVFGLPTFGPGIDRETITGSIPVTQSGNHTLFMNGEALCDVRRGARIAPTVYRLEAAANCGSALGQADQSLYWTETASGGVIFSGTEGAIIEFTEADGSQLESVLPTNPLYSLRRKSR